MRILVLNSGSSSIKWALYEDSKCLQSSLLERVNDFDHAIHEILLEAGEVEAIGHRVVHGGEKYTQSVLIDDEVIQTIQALIPLAPLHNPSNLAGIQSVRHLYPHLPQVAVFDTAFHQTLPPHAFRYALPKTLYTEDKIRRYGFHGTSHHYLAAAAAAFLHLPLEHLNLITFHLGNGDSICAIEKGKSIDISMGFTPLEGLIMGTRCGDIDPEILLYLQKIKRFSPEQIDVLLNKESGLRGICGKSDMRDITHAAQNGDDDALLAIEMFTYHAKKYLGGYLAVLGRVDAIVFSGGIGEHSALIRKKILSGLEFFGIALDQDANFNDSLEPFTIHSLHSSIKLLVVHTDEEGEIAAQVQKTLA